MSDELPIVVAAASAAAAAAVVDTVAARSLIGSNYAALDADAAEVAPRRPQRDQTKSQQRTSSKASRTNKGLVRYASHFRSALSLQLPKQLRYCPRLWLSFPQSPSLAFFLLLLLYPSTMRRPTMVLQHALPLVKTLVVNVVAVLLSIYGFVVCYALLLSLNDRRCSAIVVANPFERWRPSSDDDQVALVGSPYLRPILLRRSIRIQRANIAATVRASSTGDRKAAAAEYTSCFYCLQMETAAAAIGTVTANSQMIIDITDYLLEWWVKENSER